MTLFSDVVSTGWKTGNNLCNALDSLSFDACLMFLFTRAADLCFVVTAGKFEQDRCFTLYIGYFLITTLLVIMTTCRMGEGYHSHAGCMGVTWEAEPGTWMQATIKHDTTDQFADFFWLLK
jgi:hypothetical protein